MDRPFAMDELENRSSSDKLRHQLAQGDAMLGGIEPILGHLLSAPDHSLFSDEIVARVRGMLSHLAREILRAQAEKADHKGKDAFVERHSEPLAEHFQAQSALLSYCHALAIEWQLTERLEREIGLDPVLSPLMQRLVASSDASKSSTAMAALAAQARFAQGQRRMELALGELPGDLLHETLLAWRRYCGEAHQDAAASAESRLRQSYDESLGRLSLFARLVGGKAAGGALTLEDAGAGLFFTAIASRSGQSRILAILSSHARQTTRLALGLRAAGLEPRRIDEVLLKLHPGAAPVAGLEAIDEDQARGMLLDASHRLGARS